MARFRPFRGLRYRTDLAGRMEDLVAPPYDVIDDAARTILCGASPHNVTHLILNPSSHDRAAELYREWSGNGVIARDEVPSFYLYSQDFESGGSPKHRTGVIGALHLEPFSRGVVRPHERTFAHHRKDRLELTRRVKANLSPIFGLYSNPEFEPAPERGWSSEADVDIRVAGVRHRLWTISDPAAVEAVRSAVEGRTVFIADGHHRYETALNYYLERHGGTEPSAARDAPGDEEEPDAHVLACLAAFEDPGMVILPTHRELVDAGGADLARFRALLVERFSAEAIPAGEGGSDRLLEALAACGARQQAAVGVAFAGADEHLVVTRSSEPPGSTPLDGLSVAFLHHELLEKALVEAGASDPKLEYRVDAEAVLERVGDGRSAAAFVLNPTRADELAAVCNAGLLMPQKSTYFHPKLLTGLVFHELERGLQAHGV